MHGLMRVDVGALASQVGRGVQQAGCRTNGQVMTSKITRGAAYYKRCCVQQGRDMASVSVVLSVQSVALCSLTALIASPKPWSRTLLD